MVQTHLPLARSGRAAQGSAMTGGDSELWPITLGNARLCLRGSGAIWAPELRLLAVADLHLGRAARAARFGGALLPPYENIQTLERLGQEISALDPAIVLSLGDAFDAPEAEAALSNSERERIRGLAAGREWLWIRGNHDPMPPDAPGVSIDQAQLGGIEWRHIPEINSVGAEAAGHYHPKAVVVRHGRRIARRCFLFDAHRLVAPAFGAYVGGLDVTDAAFDPLFPSGATALLASGQNLFATSRAALIRSTRRRAR